MSRYRKSALDSFNIADCIKCDYEYVGIGINYGIVFSSRNTQRSLTSLWEMAVKDVVKFWKSLVTRPSFK